MGLAKSLLSNWRKQDLTFCWWRETKDYWIQQRLKSVGALYLVQTQSNTVDLAENKFAGVSATTYAIDLALNDEVAHEGFAAVANGLDIGVLGMLPHYIRLNVAG